LRPELDTTGTHKIKKYQLREQGIDPSGFSDPVFVLLPDSDRYTELTPDLYQEIVAGRYRF
jgi:citronellyl-CoA synthetase